MCGGGLAGDQPARASLTLRHLSMDEVKRAPSAKKRQLMACE